MEENLDETVRSNLSDGPFVSSQEKGFPISGLHYLKTDHQNWLIKVRVTKKTGKIIVNNGVSEVKYFKMNLIDLWKGEIEAMAFGDECDRFFEIFEVNKCFSISTAVLQPVGSRSSLQHESILKLNHSTKVECLDDDDSISNAEFYFVPIKTILTMKPGSFVDVIADASFVGKVSMGLSQSTQRHYTKRKLNLIDDVGDSIVLTAWNDLVNDLNQHDYFGDSVLRIAVRGSQIVEYKGKLELGTVSTTILKINEELKDIPGFFNIIGRSSQIAPIFEKSYESDAICKDITTFQEIKDLKTPYRPERYSVRAMISIIIENSPFYEGCYFEGCRKKVNFNLLTNNYYCSKCDVENPEFRWCLILKFQLNDISGSQRVTCFQEGLEDLVGRSKLELLHHFWFSSRHELFWQQINDCLRFRYFHFRLKFEPISYLGDFPPSVVVLGAGRIDQISHCQKMIHELRHERHNRMLPTPRPLSKPTG
ncbi:replication protein A 70 kDa DNA-binding subunit-like [Daphnia pulicaria]|uniref:replication protein A 70 kDa DNA-binding subunit-like n=1 Tax=Daphnia pulicaria TaxID=35523 RepID=UPI001EECCA96|nr:replication protein A 70 kDa DNA-binding subunit-like [Daphnia pulicaria]